MNYRMDGQPFWNFFSMTPMNGADGRVEYFLGMQADVTQLVFDKGQIEAAGSAELSDVQQQEQLLVEHITNQLSGKIEGLQQETVDCAADRSVPASLVQTLGIMPDAFVLSDPNLPDGPIVFASDAFLRFVDSWHSLLRSN